MPFFMRTLFLGVLIFQWHLALASAQSIFATSRDMGGNHAPPLVRALRTEGACLGCIGWSLAAGMHCRDSLGTAFPNGFYEAFL